MYRTSAGACPACGGHLTMLRSTLQASGCDACGGLMLGPEAAVHVMKGLGDALEEEVATTGAAHERTSKLPMPPDPGTRECPSCGNLMMRVRIGTIILDSCAAHGTWFDRAELGGVVRLCRALKKRHANARAGVLRQTWTTVTSFFESLVVPDRDQG